MAVFNPQVGNLPNDNMPNYFKYSDSISQPKADESKGIALKTIGTGIEGGAALADTVVKDVIKSDVYNRVDTERDKFTTALSNAATYGNAAGPQAPPGDDPANTVVEGTPGPPVNIMASTSGSVPTGISKGLNAIARNEEGLKQDKVTQLEYIKNLNTIAKDIRMTYPGYREYVDAEISKVTGMNPANAVMDSYISTINSALAVKNKEQDYWRNKIVDSGYPGNDKVLAQFEKDGDHNKVSAYLAYNSGVRSNLALKESAFKAAGNDRATQMIAAEDLANSAAGQAATTFFYNTQKFASGDQSPADIADKMADLSLHPEKGNDVAYQGLSERYAALHAQSYNQTMAYLAKRTVNPDGTYNKSMLEVLGPTKAKEIVDKSVGALFDKTREFIADKQFGPAYSVQNAGAAQVNNAYFKILNDPTIGGRVETAAAFNKAAPNFAPILLGKVLQKGLSTELGTFVEEQGKMAVGQPVGAGKYRGRDGNIYSLRQSIEELTAAGKTTQTAIPGQAFNNLLEVRKAITDPAATPESKNNAINYFYDKINKGTMDNFVDDYYDPAKKGMVKGRSSAFAALTEPDVTKKIWDFAQGKPEAWEKYSSWAKGEFRTQLGTATRDLDELTKTNNSAYQIHWNTETKQFSFQDKEGNTPNNMAGWAFGQKMNNVNMGLKNLANIAKTEGSNVDAYIFKVLKDNGFSPTKDVEGVPAQIMRSMIVGNGGKVKEGSTSPVQRFAPEEPQGDLQSFLTNPGGSPGVSEASGKQSYQTRGVIKGNLSDETLVGMKWDEIPADMSARDFLKQLKKEGR